MNVFSGEDVDEKLLDMGISHIQKLLQLFKEGLRKYIIWQRKSYCLERFIAYCSHNRCRQAEDLSREYYEGNGGYLNNSHFLFGKASQFRIDLEPGFSQVH